MSPDLKIIEEQAMQFSTEERALLARHLIESLDGDTGKDTDELWIKESERRNKAYEAGEVDVVPADDVFAKARKAIQ